MKENTVFGWILGVWIIGTLASLALTGAIIWGIVKAVQYFF